MKNENGKIKIKTRISFPEMQQFELKLIFLASGRMPTAHRRSYRRRACQIWSFSLHKTRKLMNKNQRNCLWSNKFVSSGMYRVYTGILYGSWYIDAEILFFPVAHKCLLTSAACVACVYWLCTIWICDWVDWTPLQNVSLFSRAWIVYCKPPTALEGSIQRTIIRLNNFWKDRKRTFGNFI